MAINIRIPITSTNKNIKIAIIDVSAKFALTSNTIENCCANHGYVERPCVKIYVEWVEKVGRRDWISRCHTCYRTLYAAAKYKFRCIWRSYVLLKTILIPDIAATIAQILLLFFK